jgi:hypothetical protein
LEVKDKSIIQDTDCSNFTPDKFPIFDDLMKVIDKHLAERNDNPISISAGRQEQYHIQRPNAVGYEVSGTADN